MASTSSISINGLILTLLALLVGTVLVRLAKKFSMATVHPIQLSILHHQQQFKKLNNLLPPYFPFEEIFAPLKVGETLFLDQNKIHAIYSNISEGPIHTNYMLRGPFIQTTCREVHSYKLHTEKAIYSNMPRGPFI
ncbi:hypothetical protein RND71_014371 [Anisodus tanguticus]|uniref:Uncharacterized protein n=1 Tax=Anisodus tanguticus TaxID=243964 RepID=A0AAE1VJV1_9SOLA|nr:hypothetical protein RND71_014371 [Anisodus tanguticus]